MARYIAVLFGLMGLCYLPVVADGGLLPRQVLLAVGTAAGLVLLHTKKSPTPRLHLPELALLGWLAWQAASAGWAVNTAEVWAVVGRWSALAAFYLMLRSALASRSISLSMLATAACAFVAAELAWVLYQAAPVAALGEIGHFSAKVSGASGNKNLLSIGLFLSLPWLLWGALTRQKPAVLYRALLALSFLLLAYLQTRSVLVGGFVAAGAYAVLLLIGGKAGTARRVYVGAGVAVLLLAGILTAATTGLSAKLARTESIAERLDLWQNSFQMHHDAPIAGVGAGQWQIWFPRYGLGHFESRRVQMGVVSFQRPHNDYLWLLTEGGIVGLLLYLLFFWGGVAALWRWLRDLPPGNEARPARTLAQLALAALIGYALIAQFDFPHERPELQMLMLALMALGYSHTTPRRSLAMLHIASWALLLIALGLGLPRLSAEMHAPRLKAATRASNLPMAEREFKRARTALFTVDATTVPLAWYLGIARFQRNDMAGALPLFLEARRVAPYHFLTLNNLGSAFAKLGQTDSAEACYRRCIAISPNWDEAWLNLAAVVFNRPGGSAAAFELMRQFPDTLADPRWPLFKQTLLAARLRDARPAQSPAQQARIDTLLADPAFPARAYAAYRRSRRNADFWR